MLTFKKSLMLICLLCTTTVLPMDSASDSFHSQDDSTESCESVCLCGNCLKRSSAIRTGVMSAAETIMNFNFHNSLGDCSIEHLYTYIIAVVRLENKQPLLGNGIFTTKDLTTLEKAWKNKALTQRSSHMFGPIDNQRPGTSASQELLSQFARAIKNITRHACLIITLAKNTDASTEDMFHPFIQEIYMSIEKIAKKFGKTVPFKSA